MLPDRRIAANGPSGEDISVKEGFMQGLAWQMPSTTGIVSEARRAGSPFGKYIPDRG